MLLPFSCWYAVLVFERASTLGVKIRFPFFQSCFMQGNIGLCMGKKSLVPAQPNKEIE